MSAKTQIKSISLLSIFTLISRILGLARDILLAIVFGVSFFLDAFVIAFTIPNLFRRLFGEGALAATITPVLQKVIKEKGIKEAKNFASEIYRYLIIALVICCTIIISLCVLGLFLSFSPQINLVLQLTAIMLPYVIFICSVAFFTAILNALHHFVLPSLAPIILNIVWIIALAVLLLFKVSVGTSVYIVSFTILFAGALQMLLFIPALGTKEILPFDRKVKTTKQAKQLFINFLQSSIGVMIVQINVLVDRLMAWVCIPEEGAVTVLYIGNRLMQFPLAIIGISVATVIFPLFTQHILDKNMKDLESSLGKSLHWTFFLAFPATVGLWAIAEPLITLFFQYKSFGNAETVRTATIVSVYSTAIWIFCLQHIINKVFYAFGDIKTPMKISCISTILNVVLNFSFVYTFAEVGLAIATIFTAITALIFSWYLLQQKLSFSIKIQFLFIAKVLFSCLIMLLVVMRTQDFFYQNDYLLSRLANCFSPICAAIPTYFIINWILQTKYIQKG